MQKEQIAKKMKPFKPKPQGKKESDHSHWHRLAKDFHESSKGVKRGMPASYYKW